MKRIGLALALTLILGVALLPATAGASHRPHMFVGCCVFINPGNSVVLKNGFFNPRFGSAVVINPAPVWVQGFWQWTGFQWMWVPGQWVFPSQPLFLRNPCE